MSTSAKPAIFNRPHPPVSNAPKVSTNGFSQTLSDFWLYNLEIPLDQIGLGNPNLRFLVVTLATAGLLWWIRPRAFFFEKTGKARPNRIADRDNPDSVVLDWVLFSIFMGSISVLIV